MVNQKLRHPVCGIIAALGVLLTGLLSFADEARRDEHANRRIIFNDDGGELKHMKDGSIDSYLSKRLAGLANTQVDTVFFCGNEDLAGVMYKSKIAGIELRGSPALSQLLDQGIDPMQETIDFCRQNKLEIFYSFRMNDIHDSYSGRVGPFKRDHPELLLGSKSRHHPPANLKQRTLKECNWSALNYELAPVREHIMRSMEEVIDRWEWDGLEFDYGRNASLFPAVFEGQSATDEDRAILTKCQRLVRDKTNAIAIKRGRPYYLAVVVPETVELARYVGIDIERWLKEDLIDMIIAGNGYVPFSPAAFEMVSLGRKYGVPVHIRINANTGTSEYPYHKYIEVWRACATNAFAAGSAGTYLFNTFDAKYFNDHELNLFNEIGDAKALAFRDKLYLADWDRLRMDPAAWDVAFYMPRENVLPMLLAEKQQRVEFTCFEDLQAALAAGKSPKLILRLSVAGTTDKEEFSFDFNESRLKKSSVSNASEGVRVYEYILTPDQVSRGTNTIRAEYQPEVTNTPAATLTKVELWIRYPDNEQKTSHSP